MAVRTPWPIAAVTALLLGGCADGPRLMYTWGDYQSTIYQYYQKEKSTPTEQIAELNEIIEQARADNRPVPPGLHAHLGLLYVHQGKDGEARREFTAEKVLYPESGPYMDFLTAPKEQQR